MKVAYVTNAPGSSGVGKPAREIAERLKKQSEISLTEFSLQAQRKGPKPLEWWRLSRDLPKEGFDLWHFTNQTLSFIPRSPAVLTVFDIIEILEPQRAFGKMVARFLYRGIPKAAHIICVSQYSRKSLQSVYQVPDERITIVPLAANQFFSVDENAKYSVAYAEFLHKFELTPEQKIILYVGSDHPRKNLPTLARAFAQIKKDIPDAVLMKVGDPGVPEGRVEFLRILDELGIRDKVKFYGNAKDQALRFLYNIADVFVFPSTFEGFGIPPLEAMACGCPVVVSNATSLSEVVGDAALLHDPHDVEGFAASIKHVLTNKNLAQDLRQRGLSQATKFSWKSSAQKTLEVYRKVLV